MFLIDSMRARGGMERMTAAVAAGLAQLGFTIQILTLRGETSAFPLADGVELASLGLPDQSLRLRTETRPIMQAVRAAVQRWKPDVFIAVDSFLSVFAFPVLLDLPVRRVAWEHFNVRTDLNMRSRRLARWAAAYLGHDVVTLTEQDTQHWTRAFPRARASIGTIPNLLPFARPATNPYALERRVVLAAGRLDGQKGFDLLLEAWAQIEAQHPEWRLELLGEGVEEANLRRQATQLGLQRWTLRGSTTAIEEAYRQAGVYCLSSRHEGLPMVLLESQAYGVPAVAFDCPTGPAEILASGGGRLVAAQQVSALAQTLAEVLSQPAQRLDMSGRAYDGSQRYLPEQILARWVTLLTGELLPAGALQPAAAQL